VCLRAVNSARVKHRKGIKIQFLVDVISSPRSRALGVGLFSVREGIWHMSLDACKCVYEHQPALISVLSLPPARLRKRQMS
jgi:hypothetical protein